ncbi:hypothetical protein [Jiangella sp. DSM 45060]|uniref:hypothetical protein n=1 Tax=Jiangella sp. DSM 45060 TaxID=1798224 RepID=UPI00087CE9F9|nr:hypothetical protein [Jiangella sp. DSM 45060]SDT72686.1 hypothetical protein SAMN04515669_6721 [Jiangella sp. DSM 45060]
MGLTATIIAASLAVIVGLAALVAWGLAEVSWRELRKEPEPHDSASHFRIRADVWRGAPSSVQWWLSGARYSETRTVDDVQVGEVLAVLDGTWDNDGGDIQAQLRVALPDGREVVVDTPVHRERTVQAGTFLPVRPQAAPGEDWSPAVELDEPGLRAVLARHRSELGLLEPGTARDLLDAQPAEAALTSIRPTGRVRRGHVEVEVETTGGHGTARGFLRPQEIATMRHTGTALVCETREGQRVLWPAWY